MAGCAHCQAGLERLSEEPNLPKCVSLTWPPTTTFSREAELDREYEILGKTRFEEGVPLHESVRALYVIKDKMIDFVKEQGVKRDSMELYAEEELEHRVGRFFDELVIHLVRGYEGAWRRAAHAAA